MKTFKLIVKPSPNCIDLLRYLNKNIKSINKLGVTVRVEKISQSEFNEDMVNALKAKGITRLPTLVAPEGKIFVGLKSITDLFEKNLNNNKRNARLTPGRGPMDPATNAEIGSNPDMSNFWMREMYAGIGKNGKPLARQDKDEPEDESADIQKRIAEYQRNIPAQRRQGNDRERDIDPPPRQRGARRQPLDEDDANPNDNIADIDPTPVRPRLPALRSGDAQSDDLDQRMLAAWLDNTPE
jgi:hypothetical protein